MNLELSKLKDIHLPMKPDFFPLAWGWLFLFWGLILLVVVLLYIRFWSQNNPKCYALKMLRRINKQEDKGIFLKQTNELLKRSAFQSKNSPKEYSLYGKKWLLFLNQTKGVSFPKDYVDILEKNMYASKNELSAVQREEIYQNARRWIKLNL